MSLINDALQRARQARQPEPSERPPSVPLRPVDYAARPGRLVRIVIALLMLTSLALSGWFFWQWWRIRVELERTASAADGTVAFAAAKSDAPAPRMRPIKVSTDLVVRANFVPPSQPETAALPALPDTALPAPSEAAIPPPANAPTAAGTNVVSSPPTNALAPAPTPAGPFADLKLQSIIFRENKPAVVINGELLVAGDKIRGARILKIEPQSVMVERGGETNELSLRRL